MRGLARARSSGKSAAGGPVSDAAPVTALLRLLPTASARLTGGLAALVLLDAALAPALTVAIGALAGRLPAAAGAGLDSAAGRGVLTAFGVLALIYLANVLMDPVIAGTSTRLARRLAATVSRMTMRGTLRPAGQAPLDGPRVADLLMLAQGRGTGQLPVGLAVTALPRLIAVRLAGVSAAGLLLLFAWWAPIPLVVAWVVMGRRQDRATRRAADSHAGTTTELRRAEYLRSLALEGAAAKEIRVFGLGEWLVEHFTRAWLTGTRELAGRRRADVGDLACLAGLIAAHALVLVPLTVAAARGDLSVARTTICLQAVLGTASLGWLGDLQWTITRAAAAAPAARRLAELGRGAGGSGLSPLPVGSGLSAGPVKAPALGGAPAHAIRFEAVRFRYPDRHAPTLDRLDLTVPAGSSLALVGDNGAGKTTVIKLLARLYDPAAGRITTDGTDLRALPPDSWRRHIAVVFQDFLRYELSARDNIRFGAVDAAPDRHALASAARRAGADAVLDGLPDGWDTPLSRRFTGGTDISGGQWQRIALARALYAVEHGARILVLDEPTAHLDIRAEAELYEQFLDLTRGLTTILVSHRFATVRLADRICFLDGGRVAEEGTHDELLAAGGRYARSFSLQAATLTGEAHA
ncbi:ABC transporter ATP-binding protein [Streptomyces sp. A7024]|uniref:ABC transporter ATP-binding protein n=1 Tax=Streptomyces coryli TaxID=1128680 RepID=A0A6G4TR09_9ACTN|nr:ABC transporter ATP-binding protein [Streptomyces coryli]NGN62449.1 ABC transporter ATP-binding protein [Streptomyces coryli]